MGSNPWSYIGLFVLIGGGGIILLSLLSALAIGFASGRHAERVTKSVLTELEKKLPCTDCGECGCKTCGEYAAQFLNREAVTPCPYCTQVDSEAMEAITDEFWKKTEETEEKLPKGWRKFGS